MAEPHITSLKILIVEDELLMAKSLRQTLEKAGHRITGIARTFQAALDSAIANPPDLALVDIRLENSTVDGVGTARELRLLHAMPIIYLTASSELSQFRAAQETHPAGYLLKPYNASELLFNVALAYQNFRPTNEPGPLTERLMLPTDGGYELIYFDEVKYVRADDVYVKVIIADGTNHLVSTGLGQLEQYFQKPNFFRISRSYLVNLDYIKRLKDSELQLTDGVTVIPVPTANRKELLKRLTVVKTKPGRDK